MSTGKVLPDKAAAERPRAQVKFSELVKLNVGGKTFTTSLTTLTKYPDCMLGAMFSGNYSAKKDEDGYYFIDRDGELFRYVLNYLRNSTLRLPNNFKEYDMLMDEADFYQIEPLKEAISTYREGIITEHDGPQIDYVKLQVQVQHSAGISPEYVQLYKVIGAKNILKKLPSLQFYINHPPDTGPDRTLVSDDCSWCVFTIKPRMHGVYFNHLQLVGELEELGFIRSPTDNLGVIVNAVLFPTEIGWVFHRERGVRK